MDNHLPTRRRLLGLLGSTGAAIVAGFDPVGRRWISDVEAAQGVPFVSAPPLDGVLLLDLPSREAVSTDKGNLVRRVPVAVLRPGSVEDIQRMIRYCRRYDLKVATRGQAHTMFGQSLSDGLVIENGALDRIHSIGPDGADVDAGVRWKDLTIAAFAEGLTPPVLTGYTNLSVGGTLSVGGISGRYHAGAQVDHISELEVVTGVGDVQRCSADRHDELFEVMLGGLGQCGVITRAQTALVPVKPMARLYTINHTNTAAFFSDLRTLTGRGQLDECYSLWVPFFGPTPGFQIQAVAYYDDVPPDAAQLLGGLTVPHEDIPFQDFTYLQWILNVDFQVDALRALFGWDALLKPWFDVWLPERTAEQYIASVMPTLTVEDIGPFGFLLIFPLQRSKLTRPFFRVPPADGGDWIYLFDILTVSPGPGPNPAFVDAMLARNRRLYEEARDAGATRYPIGALEFGADDWRHHYGALWDTFRKAKQRFDPDNILSPGSGIFR